MTIADRAALLLYRLRPVEPAVLGAAVAVAVAAGVATIPGGPPAAGELRSASSVTTPLAMITLGLAVTVGFVGGRDVDAAEQLLSSAPRPYRRALVLRVVLWAAVIAAVVAVLGERAASALEASTEPLRAQVLVHVLFAASVTLVLSRAFGSLAGGGAALALLAVVAGIPLAHQDPPIHLLASPVSAAWAKTALRLELASAALLGAAYWRARP